MTETDRPSRRHVARYGWVPDLPDHRDHLFAVDPEVLAVLPPRVDLRHLCPPVYDQGQLGSCTANAIAGAFEFMQVAEGLTDFVPSRLLIYWNERVIEGTTGTDSGAMLRDGIKSVYRQGVCDDTEWPYDVAKFADRPPDAAFADALTHRVTGYRRVTQSVNQLRGCLASGHPFVFGFSVYESFESDLVAKTGTVPLPSPREQQLGGHAVAAVGYSDAAQTFLVRNSWGRSWGMAGYCTMPYAYLTDRSLASDFWAITAVAKP